MNRAAAAAILALCLTGHGLAECAATGNSRGPSTDFTLLKAANFPDGINSVQAAGAMWNSVNPGGFPTFVTSIPSGTYNAITVNYAGGISPTTGECGSFPGAGGGNTIDVYGNTRDPRNPSQMVACNPFGTAQTIAHELGHFLRLQDQPANTTCPTCIMAQVNGLQHSIQPCESAMADTQNQTSTERGADGCRVQKNCQCLPNDRECLGTPIVIDLGEKGYQLNGLDDPVAFDLNANGNPEETAWTAPDTPMAFLWLDRDGDGIVKDGSELFGNHTPIGSTSVAVNGFEALRQYDENGDEQIDSKDPIWPSLRLWIDRNHDGISQPDEIYSLDQSPVAAISVAYRYTGRRDRFGNQFRYEADIWMFGRRGQLVRRSVFDIYFRRFNDGP